MVDAWPVKHFLCALCARSICRVYQTEVSKTMVSEFAKTQDYSEVYIIAIPLYLRCILDSVCI